MLANGEIMKKRIISFFIALVMLASTAAIFAVPTAAYADPKVSGVDGALVYNFENKKTIYSFNADKKLYPTSTVKIMVGILAVEYMGKDLDKTVTITAEMLRDVVGNNIDLMIGETVTYGDLIWTLLVNGANDSAYVIAHVVGAMAKSGSKGDMPPLDNFITLMNKRARELGAYNTNYTNPTGMHDDNMYTTVADVAALARHAYTMPLFMEASSSVKYTMPATNMAKNGRNVYNRNCLLSVYYDKNYYDTQAVGMNAGSTKQGGHSVVTTSSYNDLSYLVIAMGGQTVDGMIRSYVTATELIDWAYEAYTYTDVLSPDKIICEIPVTLSTVTDFVNCVAVDTLNVYLPSDVDVETAITLSYVTYSESLQAPVTQGQVVGSVTAMYGDEILGTSDMVATVDITRDELLHSFYKIEQFSKSRFFIATIISAVVFTAVYIFGTAFIRGRRMKNNGRRRRF